jgi:hypothetical protein
MPLRDFRCAACDKTSERFYHPGTAAELRCPSCGGVVEPCELSAGAARKTGVFPYVNPNIDGKGTPITVESLGHLRQLERQYGVVATAFTQDSNDSPRVLPEFRPDGRAYEGERPRDAYARQRQEAVRRAARNMELRKYAKPIIVR